MPSVDLKELSPRHRDEHARRLRRIKRSIERHDYPVDSNLVACGMIREACSFEAANRLAD
ncbi:MAG: hypothetical protein HZB44_02510 [Actinobacteria bacterium]|nr:hypothetical protein [Actinomycetota bacterium]